SRKIAAEHKDPSGRPKKVGDKLKIGSDAFTIIGIYETGSFLLDPVIVMDIETARKVVGKPEDRVSSYHVEADDPGSIDRVAKLIEDSIAEPRLDARSMSEFAASFGTAIGQLDTFLLMAVSRGGPYPARKASPSVPSGPTPLVSPRELTAIPRVDA